MTMALDLRTVQGGCMRHQEGSFNASWTHPSWGLWHSTVTGKAAETERKGAHHGGRSGCRHIRQYSHLKHEGALHNTAPALKEA